MTDMAGLVDEAARCRFVVLGFLRSGTTLLRRLLDAHPAISCPPETNLLSGVGRLLEEVPAVAGLTIGVRGGLGFSGIGEDELHARLRDFVFSFEERIAGDKPVWVEKTAADSFYLDRLEPLLVGHCRFLCVIRHPLDVIVSVKDLCDGQDQFLPELLPYVRRHTSLLDAYAEAWVEQVERLDDFIARHPQACFAYRYEDMVADPAGVLQAMLDFMDVGGDARQVLDAAFSGEAKVGLGDWRTYDTRAVTSERTERWREAIPASTLERIVPRLAPLMERHGYEVPRLRKVAKGDRAIRQYELAKQLAQNMTRAD